MGLQVGIGVGDLSRLQSFSARNRCICGVASSALAW